MIIAYEYGCVEHIESKLTQETQGFGAALSLLVTALYQETAPILVPAPLWYTLLYHKKLFEDFALRTPLETAQREYGAYKRFQSLQALKDFKEGSTYVHNLYTHFTEHIYKAYPYKPSKLERLIREDPLFDESAAPLCLQSLHSPLWKELLSYLMCASVPVERYLVKRLVHPEHPQAVFYLFIPYAYLALRQLPSNKLIADKDASLTDRELLCGLKIDHYPDVTHPFELPVDGGYASLDYYDAFVPLMHELFVKNDELDGRPSVNWVIYMLGHGNFSQKAYEQLREQEKILYSQERVLQKLKEDYKRQVKLYESAKKKKIPAINAYQSAMIQAKKALEQQEKKCVESRELKAALRSCNTIAGLPTDQFRAFLLFMDHAIKTRFFFYSTCSAGGEHFVTTYLDPVTLKPYALNYAILADALAEAPSTSKSPCMHLSYYHNQFESAFWPIPFERLVDWKNAALTIDSPYQFSTFFAYAHAHPFSCGALQGMLSAVSPVHKESADSLKMSFWKAFIYGLWQKICALCKQLIRLMVGDIIKIDTHSLERDEIKNIPSMRLPGEVYFRVIDLGRRFFVLPGSTLNNPKAQVSVPRTDVVFLYSSDYPTLEIDAVNVPFFPAFVSMIPGTAVHTFAAIRAQGHPMSEVIESFFSCPELNVTKVFFIKELTCIQDIFLKEIPYASLQTFRDIVCINKKPSKQVKKTTGILAEEATVHEVSFSVGSQRYKASWKAHEPFPRAFCSLFDSVCYERFDQVTYIKNLLAKHTFCTIEAPLLTLEEASAALNNRFK